jgi:hypothetical protein
VDFQVMKNGQIFINLFGNIKVLPFLSKPQFESRKKIHWFLRYCQIKLVILTQKCVFWAKNGQNHQFEAQIPQE